MMYWLVQTGAWTYRVTACPERSRRGLASTTELLDAQGNVTGSYRYDVFGAVRSHTGSSTEFTFTGEQNDPNGLEYLRARYYDKAIGRFLGRDPVAGDQLVPGTLNAFIYVLNNPANMTDPTGMWPGCPKKLCKRIGRAFADTARFVINAPLSLAALYWAEKHGGDCDIQSNLMFVCSEMSGGYGSRAGITIGNVFLTG